MTKNKKTTVNISSSELINLFKKSAKEGFDSLLSSGNYRNKKFNDFWELFNEHFDTIDQNNPNDKNVLQKTIGLNCFHTLNTLYSKSISEIESEIVLINPSKKILIKTIFLSLELKDKQHESFNHKAYNSNTLAAVKKLIRNIFKRLDESNSTSYSLELYNKVNFLIGLHKDQSILYEFTDLFLWADFELLGNDDNTGYTLKLAPYCSKISNSYISNKIKNNVKRNFQRAESNKSISKEKHFEKIDPFLKTDKGLAISWHSPGMSIIEQMENTTSIEIKEEYLKKITSTDAKERQEGTIEIMLLMLDQNFNFRYREALANIYQPNDELNIHRTTIQLHDFQVSLYEIFATFSCITALSDNLRYLDAAPDSPTIDSLRQMVYTHISNSDPHLTHVEKNLETSKYIANYLDKIEKDRTVFTFYKKDFFLKHFKKIEELKNKPNEELELILQLFYNVDGKMPFLPIYKTDEEFYFSYKTCLNQNLNRTLYDYLISKELFDVSNPNQKFKNKTSENANKREARFNAAIKENLGLITPYVGSNIPHPGPDDKSGFKSIDGDFDVIAYFKEENMLLPIQVKLSNTSSLTEFSKNRWINSNITMAAKQISKDLAILQAPMGDGLKYISKRLNLKEVIPNNVRIHPLIVTDNFYADHQPFPYNSNGDLVTCISFFELKHIINKTKVSDKQSSFFENNKSISANELIKVIEENQFWNFLSDYIDQFYEFKTLETIDEINRISLII